MASPENRHMKVSTGENTKDLRNWATSHPFTQQVDILFPSSDSDEIERCLFSGLSSGWYSGKTCLSQIVACAEDYASRGQESQFLALTSRPDADDGWCIDPRGVLTLCVCKETYECLGLVGKKLPFKGCPERYVIGLPLQKQAESVKNRAKRDAAIKSWDANRNEMWDVHVYAEDTSIMDKFPSLTAHTATPNIRKTDNSYIPSIQLTHRPGSLIKSPSAQQALDLEDEVEDWNHEVVDLFEWVGMACLGAQRLQVNDRVDPYIAVYEPPSPSYVGSVTHICWKGFFSPQFIQKILDAVLTWSQSSPPFISMTAHSIPTSPVVYIPPISSQPNTNTSLPTSRQPPLRMPRIDGEYTWCVIVNQEDATGVNSERASGGEVGVSTGGSETSIHSQMDPKRKGAEEAKRRCPWMMVESIGKWDARWG